MFKVNNKNITFRVDSDLNIVDAEHIFPSQLIYKYGVPLSQSTSKCSKSAIKPLE